MKEQKFKLPEEISNRLADVYSDCFQLIIKTIKIKYPEIKNINYGLVNLSQDRNILTPIEINGVNIMRIRMFDNNKLNLTDETKSILVEVGISSGKMASFLDMMCWSQVSSVIYEARCMNGETILDLTLDEEEENNEQT